MKITEIETKELRIQSTCEVPLETLVLNQAIGGGNLMWIDGVVICFAGFNASEFGARESLDGIFNWMLLEYNYEMPEYQPTINAKNLNQQVPVFNMSFNPFYQKVKEFIESKHKKHDAFD